MSVGCRCETVKCKSATRPSKSSLAKGRATGAAARGATSTRRKTYTQLTGPLSRPLCGGLAWLIGTPLRHTRVSTRRRTVFRHGRWYQADFDASVLGASLRSSIRHQRMVKGMPTGHQALGRDLALLKESDQRHRTDCREFPVAGKTLTRGSSHGHVIRMAIHAAQIVWDRVQDGHNLLQEVATFRAESACTGPEERFTTDAQRQTIRGGLQRHHVLGDCRGESLAHALLQRLDTSRALGFLVSLRVQLLLGRLRCSGRPLQGLALGYQRLFVLVDSVRQMG